MRTESENKILNQVIIWKRENPIHLTASRFGASLGLEQDSIRDTIHYILGIKKKTQTYAMKRGIEMEDEARQWYKNRKSVIVEDPQFFVDKDDRRIGCIPDGLIGDDGLLEIKCPLRMYEEIEQNRIKDSHYCQIQGSLKITNRRWCDYVIYVPQDDKAYIKRIIYDEKFWREVLKPGIDRFFIEMEKEIKRLN